MMTETTTREAERDMIDFADYSPRGHLRSLIATWENRSRRPLVGTGQRYEFVTIEREEVRGEGE